MPIDEPHHATDREYQAVVGRCRGLFEAKFVEYGPAWRMFRLISVVDQIYIKARRIRQLEQMTGKPRIADTAEEEYTGILNYAVMAIWHLESGDLREVTDTSHGIAWLDGWVPDGTAVLVARQVPEGASSRIEIWRMDTATGEGSRLAEDANGAALQPER